jgi:hypothetical protein
VCGHTIAAISQRDPSQHFPQLASAAEAEAGRHSLRSIQQRVVDFHTAHIGSSFPLDSCECCVGRWDLPCGPGEVGGV